MNNGEVLNGCPRNSDVRNPFRWRRQRREKRKWEMAHSIAKLGTIGPVPGIDGVESFELRDPGPSTTPAKSKPVSAIARARSAKRIRGSIGRGAQTSV